MFSFSSADDETEPEEVLTPEEQSIETHDEEQAPRVQRPRKAAAAKIKATEKEEKVKIIHKQLAEECSVIVGASCGMMAWATKHDFWALDERESSEAGKAIANAVPTIPGKQAEALAKRLPMIRLVYTLGSIFGFRIMAEIEVRKAEALARTQGATVANANGYGRAPTATQPEPPQTENTVVKQAAATSNTNAPKFEIPGLEESYN